MEPLSRKTNTVTIHDVARVAGTSPSTVSRVLTGRANVRETKRKAVLAAIEELGYSPNLLARGLKTRITYTLGLILGDIQSPFFSAAAKGAQDYAAQRGYAVLLCDTNEAPDKQRMCMEMLRTNKVDGVIWVPSSGAEELASSFLSADMHLVQIDRQVEGLPISSVVVNDEEASFKAVQHLISNGYQRIALLTFQQSVTTHDRRHQGYRRALLAAGQQVPASSILLGETSSAAGHRLTRKVLANSPPPDALFATSSRLGVGALRALHEAGVRIRDDIGIVVFDDIPAFALMHPSITAVRQPAYDIGWKAAEILIQSIEADRPLAPTQLVLQAELVVRESSVPH